MSDAAREAFEAVAKERFFNLKTDRDGHYKSLPTLRALDLWRAAFAAGRASTLPQRVEQDAARYRWLRDHTGAGQSMPGSPVEFLEFRLPLINKVSGANVQHLDASIDAAMSAAPAVTVEKP